MTGERQVIEEFSGPYRFLSNFFPVQIEYEGQLYRSVEHAYQAAKSLDSEVRAGIASCSSPGTAKKAGQQMSLRNDWEEVKLSVMEELLRLKFSHEALKSLLLATDGHDLIEGNWWGDRFWGVCKGSGQNHLGKLLMKIREELS